MKPKIHVISQHFPPDATSTAKYLAAVAEELSVIGDVVVVSGTPDPKNHGKASLKSGIELVHLKNHQPPKGQLLLRAIAMTLFAARVFSYCMFRVNSRDAVVAVTTPYSVTYAVGLAARLKRLRAVLMLYDLYPDVLVQAGLVKEHAFIVRLLSGLNRLLLPGYKAIIVIGRDMERRLGHYLENPGKNLAYIPMWSDVDVAKVPPISSPRVTRYRPINRSAIVVSLSGNLGFTHDPETVFEAARLLQSDTRLHFVLSGWGVGWTRLQALQEVAQLPNVTLVDAVSEADLGAFLMSGDLWLIPYKKGMMGVSVPSRFYNLLALGKPILTLAEPEADHSGIILADEIGWVVEPGNHVALADRLSRIASKPELLRTMGDKAQKIVAPRYTRRACGELYRQVVTKVLSAK